MFTITPDGVLSLDGTVVGTIEVQRDEQTRLYGRRIDMVATGLQIVTSDNLLDADDVLYTSIASRSARRVVQEG